MKKILIILLFILFISGCENKKSDEYIPTKGLEEEIRQNNIITGTIDIGKKCVIEGNGITVNQDIIVIEEGGKYIITGKTNRHYIYINALNTSSITLFLNGVSFNNKYSPIIYSEACQEVEIHLVNGSKNYFINQLAPNGNTYSRTLQGSIDLYTSLKISGSGSLDIVSSLNAIEVNDDLVIENGLINITSSKNAINTKGNITINNGDINILNANEGIASSNKNIYINGGNIKVNSIDDCISSKDKDITINDGTIALTSTYDAIDSNGKIFINGGIINCQGGLSPEGGIDCDNRELSISGGEVLSFGGKNSLPTNVSNIITLYIPNTVGVSNPYGEISKNSVVGLVSEGEEVLTFDVSVLTASLIISSSKLKENVTYSFYTYSKGSTFTEGYKWFDFIATENGLITKELKTK